MIRTLKTTASFALVAVVLLVFVLLAISLVHTLAHRWHYYAGFLVLVLFLEAARRARGVHR